jgi:hypothetical protein
MKAFSSTENEFRMTFSNGMTVSVAWYRKATSDGGQTSAEVIVWDKHNRRYEYNGEALHQPCEGLDEWAGTNHYVTPSTLVEILREAERYKTNKTRIR